MYSLFCEKYPGTKLKLHKYREVFNDNFNLRFGLPRSDTCKTCDKFFIQMTTTDNESERNKIKIESEIHHRKAEKAYSSLADDVNTAKNNPNCVVLCVDLQQVIFTPNLKHSDIFYQRQYSNYNFAIHNMGNDHVTMCLWHETVAKRGSSEIASCIIRYITTQYSPLLLHEERKLVIWSDRCVGQNNNWKMLTICHYLVLSKYFSEVNQTFLVSGHSFLPCDRDFAVIENAKKTSILNTPCDVKDLILRARSAKPFHVLVMEQENFLDFFPIQKQIDKNTKDFKITEARWLQFVADNPMDVRVRKTHNVLETWKVHKIVKQRRGNPVGQLDSLYTVIDLTNLSRLYDEELPITKEKKSDLLKMTEYLPVECREFYLNLPVNSM